MCRYLWLEKSYIAVGELASHRHVGIDIDNVFVFGWDKGSLKGTNMMDLKQEASTSNRLTTGYTGNNGYHENTSPCIATYAWKRTS